MARVFEYLECPQYLRKQMFPIHSSLQYAGWFFSFKHVLILLTFLGLLNPLDAMHHLRSTDLELSFREGIVLDKPSKNGQRCDVGLDQVSARAESIGEFLALK
jgi:predicted SPOUT superfamily RNA methylase MTH1